MTSGRLVHDLLARSARVHGTRLAVVDGERSMTYAELDARANQLARLLADVGVERGDRVGLYLDKSMEAVVAVYGILKAGAAYVPHDPQAPTRRLAFMEANCGIEVLVSSTAKRERWPELLDHGSPVTDVVVLDAAAVDDGAAEADERLRCHLPAAIDRQRESALELAMLDLDLAYILYTSGSTGDPKGVKLSHLNARSFVDWGAATFDVTADDRLSSHAPLHFDLSVFDLFVAASAGAAVVIVPPRASMFPVELRDFIERQGISVWYSVPSVLTMLATRGGLRAGDLPSLRTILFAGEVFPTKYLRQLTELLPHVRFANLYGPTETNVCTWYDVPPLTTDDPIPIGRAIDNVEVFALDEDGRVAPPGAVGELHVRGTTVMRGYWGDPERTARVLGPNPLDPELDDPVYRTGDLVRADADGTIHYLGRRDAQIKSRGYRIELGEIEAGLNAHDAVLECAVVAVPDDLFTNRIKAVVVAADVDERELASFLAARLPKYMVPELWDLRASLPRTSTGKIDRRSLAADAP